MKSNHSLPDDVAPNLVHAKECDVLFRFSSYIVLATERANILINFYRIVQFCELLPKIITKAIMFILITRKFGMLSSISNHGSCYDLLLV